TLRYLAHLQSERRRPPEDALLDYLREAGLEELGFNPAERTELVDCFIERLANGEALLLLDGLDEQRDPAMKQATNEAIVAFLRRFPHNRCLVTSRIVGYRQAPLGGEFRLATLEPFTDAQMQQFFENWHQAVEKGQDTFAGDEAIRRRAQRQAADLIGQIRANPGIRSLAANPLLCTIIGLIHRQGGTLPQHRVELYKLCVDTFIFNWEMHKRRRGFADPGLDKDETQAVLEVIALYLHEQGVENRAPRPELEGIIKDHLITQRGLPAADAECKAAQLLDLVRDVAGLLIDRGEASYGFFHLAFQEYLSARAITRKRQEIPKYLTRHLLRPRWREVFRLASAHQGLKDEESGSRFIESVLATSHPRESELRYAFRLAFLCGRETRMEPSTADGLMQKWITIYFGQDWLQEPMLELPRTPGLEPGYRAETLAPLLEALRDKNLDVRWA
ncbi:MAG: NACHT domain-containing protein, partial [bacterium]